MGRTAERHTLHAYLYSNQHRSPGPTGVFQQERADRLRSTGREERFRKTALVPWFVARMDTVWSETGTRDHEMSSLIR
jgi:hypothetical protein